MDITGGEDVHFSSASRDIDGIIVRERWDFGDGTEVIENKTEVVHTFNKKGLFEVKLTVWDNYGINRSISALFNVSNAPPVVILKVGNRANEDETVHMDVLSSFDPNVKGKDFYSSVLWDFGDGTQQNYSLETSHIYHKKGTYNITIFIKDLDEDNPLTGFAVSPINIHNLPPEANATYTDKKGATITFSGAGSSDTPSDQATLRYSWDFGDGKKGNGEGITHHFKKDGNYTVVLTVTDDDNANATSVLLVNITSDRSIQVNYWAVAAFIGLFILLIAVWVHPKFRKKKEKREKRVGKKGVIKKVKVGRASEISKTDRGTDDDKITDEGPEDTERSVKDDHGTEGMEDTSEEKSKK